MIWVVWSFDVVIRYDEGFLRADVLPIVFWLERSERRAGKNATQIPKMPLMLFEM